MVKLLLLRYAQILAISMAGSCTNPQIDFPERASAIEGIYQADTYYDKTGITGVYPIQGHTMTLKLIRINSDSVQVEIESTPNGDYSPGGNRSFKKVLVNQEFDAKIVNNKQETCLAYSVDLPKASTSDSGERLRRLCKISGIYYYFTTPISKSEAIVYFAVK